MDNFDLILNGQVPHANLVLRATSTSSPAPDHTCGPNACEKPTSSSTFTLPIILGVAVPLCGAAILFLILQRRHTRKQREEDANDRTASLDFGMGDVPQSGRQNTNHGYLEEEKSELSRRQISMDLSMTNNPYLPSPGLNNSRKSLQSLSKSIEHEDPYRPVPQYSGSDAASLRPQSKQSTSNSSLGPSKALGQSTNLANRNHIDGSQDLENTFAPNASQIDQLPHSQAPYSIEQPPQAYFPKTPSQLQNGWEMEPQSIAHPGSGPYYAQSPQDYPDQQLGYSIPQQPDEGRYLQQVGESYGGHSSSGSIDREPTLPSFAVDPPPLPNQGHQYDQRSNNHIEQGNSFVAQYPTQYEEVGITRQQQFSTNNFPQNIPEHRQNTRIMDPNRISMGFRPLPPENFIETDDPEVRANRIRSFYKEYFDESTPAPVGQYPEDYNDYYSEEYGSYIPYSQPMTRRAMTPPLEGARYRPEHGRNGSTGASSYSAGRREPYQFHPEVRPHSSASGRQQPGPRRPIPPPELNNLPTPAKLKDDALAINPINFAPPSPYRGAGRLEKPQGDRPPFLSVVSGSQELAPMPSPHMLRNSKSFTSLDFAPPRKFKDVDNNSDAGSIRSNKSGMSSIRNRAYTEDLLPQENLKTSLRPQWDMSGR